MKIKFRLFGREVSFSTSKMQMSFYSVKIPKVMTGGITSRCMDLNHVLFLDSVINAPRV